MPKGHGRHPWPFVFPGAGAHGAQATDQARQAARDAACPGGVSVGDTNTTRDRPVKLRLRLLPSLLLVAAALAGCDDEPTGGCACTEEFRTFTVTVLDDAMQPAQGVTLTRTNLRTGRVLEPGWLGLLVPGTYLVTDDGDHVFVRRRRCDDRRDRGRTRPR